MSYLRIRPRHHRCILHRVAIVEPLCDYECDERCGLENECGSSGWVYIPTNEGDAYVPSLRVVGFMTQIDMNTAFVPLHPIMWASQVPGTKVCPDLPGCG